MALTRITGNEIEPGSITSDILAPGAGAGPLISNVQITNSSYSLLDDTAVNVGGGYIVITGSNFTNNTQVSIGNTLATSVTFVSSSVLRVQVPEKTAGSYLITLVDQDTGSTGLRINGLTYSNTPTWITESSLFGNIGTQVNIQLSANSDSNVSYQLQTGSTLPAGLSLSANGLLSGSIEGITQQTIYNFTIESIDSENQESPRNFSLTMSPSDLYIPEGTTLLLGLKFNNSSLTQSGTYTTTLNQSLTYSTTGGVLNTGYATGWSIGQGISINQFTTPASTRNKTYIAWYKGTQTNSAGSYSPSVPIFSTITNDVFWGFGLSGGKISIANGAQRIGTTNIATNQWFCLAWTVTTAGVCNGFVNGVKEVSDIQINTVYPGPYLIGAGYAYAGTAAPTALDAIQIMDGILSDAQILEIYQSQI